MLGQDFENDDIDDMSDEELNDIESRLTREWSKRN